MAFGAIWGREEGAEFPCPQSEWVGCGVFLPEKVPIGFIGLFFGFFRPKRPFFFQMIFFLLEIRFLSLFITTTLSKTATRLPVPHSTWVSFGADLRVAALSGIVVYGLFGEGEIFLEVGADPQH